jgi:hypothetical protein
VLTIPTTTVSLLAGTTATDYGDEVDSNTAVATGVPASIIEGREVVATESDAQARVIRYYTGRVPVGTAVDSGQRIKDERSNQIYLIDNVTGPTNPAVPMDIRLDLRRIT